MSGYMSIYSFNIDNLFLTDSDIILFIIYQSVVLYKSQGYKQLVCSYY